MKIIVAQNLKFQKISEIQKEAGIKEWGAAGALGLAALNSGQSKADIYDGSTSGNKLVSKNVQPEGYDASKFSPQQKSSLNGFQRDSNLSLSQQNAQIQHKIQLLQLQKKKKSATMLQVKARISEVTKTGNLQGAIFFKNYQNKLAKEITDIDEQIKQLRGQSQVKDNKKNNQPSTSVQKIQKWPDGKGFTKWRFRKDGTWDLLNSAGAKQSGTYIVKDGKIIANGNGGKHILQNIGKNQIIER